MEKILHELEEWRNKYQQSDAELQALKDKYAELQALVKHYEERERLSNQRKFGASSEKSDYLAGQLQLFDEAEAEALPRKPEPTVEEITYTRRKQRTERQDDLSGIPVERIEHTLPESERFCPECKEAMHVMGHDTRRELEIIPARVRIIEHVREVYSCRRCERENASVPVTKAPIPAPIIKGGIASPSFVSHIMVQKYGNALPLYRQEQEFLTNGFLLSRQTMANWLLRSSSDWLEPLYSLMQKQLLSEEILHADETVLQVLATPGKASRSQSYMWLYRTSGDAAAAVVLYEYQPTRSSSHPKRFLEGFKGYLHTDGYSGYHCLSPDIKVVGCWAHARRKFNEAVKCLPPEQQKDSQAAVGLHFCNELFGYEKDFQDLSAEERHTKRLEKSKPTADAFFEWARNLHALPKSALGKAVQYALEQKSYLENVFHDGRLELSNNRAERSIKPFVIGRKNWLFSCTPKGARASSVIYSIIETAKENNLKPFEYLKYIFETMPNIPQERYAELLPWSSSLPLICRRETIPTNEQKRVASNP